MAFPRQASAIYDDDVDAIERLRDKLSRLEQQRASINKINATYRSEHRAKLKLLSSAYARDRALPYPSYVAKNLTGLISQTRARLARLEAEAQVEAAVEAAVAA